MTALSLVIGILAVYRISRMLALEDGPFDVLSGIREALGQESWVGRGAACVLCISFWLAWPIALLLPVRNWGEYVLTALALSAGVVIVHKVIG